MSHSPPTLDQTVRALQIITGSLVMGVLLLAAIAVVGLGVLAPPPQGLILSGIGVVFAVAAFVMHLVVPAIIARQQARSAEGDALHGIYQQKTIVGLAILEGAAFFNLVALIVEHNWWSLAIAGGLVFWMLAMFPTKTSVDQWVETQQMLKETAG